MNKVVLAYSGGLDTSVLIKMLQVKYDAEVYATTVDLGQHEDEVVQIALAVEHLGAER